MLSKSQPEFWRKLEPGIHFELSDIESMKDSLADKSGMVTRGSMTCKVNSLVRIRETNNLAEWIFFEIQEQGGPGKLRTLVAKLVDDAVDLKLFHVDLAAGNRREAIAEFSFLFADFAEGTDVLSVVFAKAIQNNLKDAKGKDVVELFVQKNSELSGQAELAPRQSGVHDLLATISEYGATTDVPDPEMLILELGSAENPAGGYIKLYRGVQLSDRDITVLEVPS